MLYEVITGVMTEDFLAGMNQERMALRWRDLLSGQLATPEQGSVFVADAGVDLGVVGWCAVGRARDNVADDPAWRTGGVAGFPGAELRALNLHPEAFGSVV